MKRKVLIWLFYFILWQMIAMIVNQSVILPSFLDVLNRLVYILSDVSFYNHLFITLFRVILGTLSAFVLSFIFAILSYDFKLINQGLKPLVLVSKTIPNITYILLVLIWFSREMSVFFVTLLILFPVLYTQISTGLLGVNPEHLEVLKLYPETYFHRLTQVIIP